VDIRTTNFEVLSVTNAMVREAALPDGELGGEAVGEASLDESDGALEGNGLRGEQEVDVVGHDDEGVEFVVTFGPVVLEGCDEEFSVGGNLEETTSVVSSAGDEESSGA
jgi:hypothetical protein